MMPKSKLSDRMLCPRAVTFVQRQTSLRISTLGSRHSSAWTSFSRNADAAVSMPNLWRLAVFDEGSASATKKIWPLRKTQGPSTRHLIGRQSNGLVGMTRVGESQK